RGVSPVLLRSARVDRHQQVAVLVHLRQRADDGDRERREGLRVVRQRVGLLVPARRPDEHRREIDLGDVRLPRSVREADVAGKVVLVRADLNVPLEDGRVADDARIRASLPTLELLLENDANEVRVCSHLGRPRTDEDRAKYEIEPVRARLHELLPDERITVLENTRFNAGETKNDPGFARELAEGCDLYVDDAFGSAHRAH